MDVLGEYSDSSDDNEHTNKKTKENPLLGGLLANYTDDDDENDSSGEAADSSTISCSNKKRTRTIENNALGTATQVKIEFKSLPPPILLCSSSYDNNSKQASSSTQFMKLVEFSQDYTKLLPPPPKEHNNLESDVKNEKLHEMYHQFCSSEEATSKTSPKSFASHLRAQKDFSNPHMFPSIISHFNINARASNIPKSTWNPHEFHNFEYMDRIIVAEEQSRMESIQQQQQKRQQQTETDH